MGCKKRMETKDVVVERGQIYYIRYDDSVGTEMAVGRPALVISCDETNKNNTCVVAYLSSTPHKRNFSIKVWTGKKYSHVVCNQLQTVDARRFSDFLCKLDVKDMARVDVALGYALCLNKESAEEETEKVDDNTSLLLERDTYKALYEKALSKIVELQFGKDVVVKEEKSAVPVVEARPVAVVEPVTVDVEDLKKKMMASNDETDTPKQKGRPMVSGKYCRPKLEDLKEYANESGVANVNTDDWKTIAATTGMGIQTAQSITAYRNKHGKFVDLADLLYVPRFGSTNFKRYIDMLEI
jgi:mRNA interferase MazF